MLVIGASALVGWMASAPRPLDPEAVPQHIADRAKGEILFHAGGCLSCHKPPESAKDADPALPSGGAPLKTPIGVLYPPNLTPDLTTGIGKWSDLDFLNAMLRGISPDGSHYIPAFPYTSFAHMRPEDLLDLKAYLANLKPVASTVPVHYDLAAFILRRGVGLWKLVGFHPTPWRLDPSQSASWNRGSYLVQGPGHCGECHTPRNLLLVPDMNRYLAGGPHPEGEGKVPSLRDLAGRGRYKDAKDLGLALQFGETLGYEKLSSGGMGAVQANIAQLPQSDIHAIAEYLMSLK